MNLRLILSLSAMLFLGTVHRIAYAPAIPPGCAMIEAAHCYPWAQDASGHLYDYIPGIPNYTIVHQHVCIIVTTPDACAAYGGQITIDQPNDHCIPLAGYPDTPSIGYAWPGHDFCIDGPNYSVAQPNSVWDEQWQSYWFRVYVDWGATLHRPDQLPGCVAGMVSWCDLSTAYQARYRVIPQEWAHGDLTYDQRTNADDLQVLFAAWGAPGVAHIADLTGDGRVDVDDLLIVLENWTG